MSYFEDYVEDGLCCSCCGEFLGGSEPGYVRLCASCRAEEPDERPKLEWFYLRGAKGIDQLSGWLRKRKSRVNTFNFRTDKRGKLICLLGWDDKPDSDWGKFRGNSLAIDVGAHDLQAPVETVLRTTLYGDPA